jgi:hypothetical protein
VKVVAISPQPSDDEAAAIAAALARLHSRASFGARGRGSSRASLGTLHLDPERRLSWRETARHEALDAGV